MGQSRVGIAGWSIPSSMTRWFPQKGSHLERYAQIFNCVEVNSSFYRDHQPKTYARWGAAVPADFRFSVKLSKEFTHVRKLEVSPAELRENLQAISQLGDKLGVLLVQLPPKLAFHPKHSVDFFKTLRKSTIARIALEARHPSWSESEVGVIYAMDDLVPVTADPVRILTHPALKARPSFSYYRWHGSPLVYKSSYEPRRLQEFYHQSAGDLDSGKDAWCIFDNTTFGYSIENGIDLMSLHAKLRQHSGGPSESSRHHILVKRVSP